MRTVSPLRRKNSKGSVTLETGLIFIVFMLLLIGAFDFGQFMFIHQALVERARSAVRWGAINDATNHTAIQNMVLYNQSAAPTDGTQPYFNLTTSNVTVTDVGSGTDSYYLMIQISGYSFTTLSPYLSGSMTGPAVTVSVPLGAY
jgi:Flp pilus assembly protein TadG